MECSVFQNTICISHTINHLHLLYIYCIFVEYKSIVVITGGLPVVRFQNKNTLMMVCAVYPFNGFFFFGGIKKKKIRNVCPRCRLRSVIHYTHTYYNSNKNIIIMYHPSAKAPRPLRTQSSCTIRTTHKPTYIYMNLIIIYCDILYQVASPIRNSAAARRYLYYR